MSLIVDAYNVLHCTHILPARHALMSVEQLCRLLAESPWRTGRMAVVCDGAKPALVDDRPGDVELIYAGGGRDADSLIERMVAEADAPRELVVVSNDRRIQRAARRRKAKAMASEDFLRDLVRPITRQSDEPVKPREVEDAEGWLEEFGLDENALPPVRQTPNDTPDNSVNRSARRPRHADESETDYWLREFGLDGHDPLDDD